MAKMQPFTLARQLAELSLASATTIMQRTRRIAEAGLNPSKKDRAELQRMTTEKLEAAGEALQVMGAEWLRLQASLGAASMRMLNAGLQGKLRPRQVSREAHRLHQAASASTARVLKPYHSRATRNARRLSGKG